ncbi:MAG: hypothetical protein JW982_03550 [Spirochaetes bacterium]|nr:hypothetical protein [Spirochaetota bacterium]
MFRYRPDIEAENGFFVKYSLFVMIMIILVVVYVWQNVEVLKMKIAYADAVEKQKRIIVSNDYLVYEIEKLKRIDLVEAIAVENGLTEVQYDDVVVIRKESSE